MSIWSSTKDFLFGSPKKAIITTAIALAALTTIGRSLEHEPVQPSAKEIHATVQKTTHDIASVMQTADEVISSDSAAISDIEKIHGIVGSAVLQLDIFPPQKLIEQNILQPGDDECIRIIRARLKGQEASLYDKLVAKMQTAEGTAYLKFKERHKNKHK